MKELELVPFAQLADRVIRPTLRCYVRLVWPVVLPLVGLTVLMTGMQSRWLRAIESGTFDAEFGVGLIAILFSAFMALGWTALCGWAISIVAVDLLQGRPISFWGGLRKSFEPKVFLTLALTLILLFFSFVLCMVPSLFVAPLLFVVVPVMICEGRYGVDALQRSYQLVRFNATGRWSDSGFLQASGLLFVGWGISTSIGLVVQLPFMIFQQYYLWNETLSGRQVEVFQLTEELAWVQLPVQIINLFAQMVGWFYWAVGAMVLYLELRRRSEGQDLEAAIPRILGRNDGG